MAKPLDEDVPMFDIPPAQRRRAPKTPGFVPAGHVEWTKYRPMSPLKCDDCKSFLAQHDGQGPASLDAKWRRKTNRGDQYLCIPHAQTWRTRDKLPKLETR